MHPHHLQGVLYLRFAEVTKIIKINKISRLKCLLLMVKYSIKRCELWSVIITIHGSCLLGGCINNFDCLIGVIPCWCFLYAGIPAYKKHQYRDSGIPIYKKHQHRDYTYKTVQIVYVATKQTTFRYCNYNTWHLTMFYSAF